jgi:hypothetical protein
MCIARLTNKELGRVWKKAVVPYFEILSWHSIGGPERKLRETSVRISGVPAVIRTGHVPVTN